MDELILRTLVIQFDGRVVEVFMPNVDVIRKHVAIMKEPVVHPPNRSGRCSIELAGTTFSVDADEMEPLRPVIEQIAAAVRAAAANRPPKPTAKPAP